MLGFIVFKAALIIACLTFDDSLNGISGDLFACVFDDSPGCVIDDSPGCVIDDSPSCVFDDSPGCVFDDSPGCVFDDSPGRVFDDSPGCVFDDSPACVFSDLPGFDDFPSCSCEDVSTGLYILAFGTDPYFIFHESTRTGLDTSGCTSSRGTASSIFFYLFFRIAVRNVEAGTTC
jgi:hypothetical protein